MRGKWGLGFGLLIPVAASLCIGSPAVAAERAHAVTAAALNKLLQSNPSASSVGAAQMQQVLNEAQNQPPVSITAAEAQRLQSVGSAQLTVKDAVALAQVVRDSTPVVTASTVAPPNAATSAPAASASSSGAAQVAPGVSTNAAIARARAKPTAHAAVATGPCYYGIDNDVTYETDVFGIVTVHAFHVGASVSGFCDGPAGQYIAEVGNWTAASNRSLSLPAECWTSNATYHGGEGSWAGSDSNWIHGLHTVGVGEGINGVCEFLKNGAAAVRMDAYGYWDCYNDWGFGDNEGCGDVTTLYGPFST